MKIKLNDIKPVVLIITLLLLSIFFGYQPMQENAMIRKQFDKTGGQIVAIFHKDMTEEEFNQITSSLTDSVTVLRHVEDYALFSVSDAKTYEKTLVELKNNVNVKVAQGNFEIELTAFSNDTLAATQWPIHNPGYYTCLSKNGMEERTSIEDVDMNVTGAWDVMGQDNREHRSVIIAIIDTGIDDKHPDLAQQMWVNKGEIPGDGIDNDGNGYIDDVHGWDFYNNDASICHYKSNTGAGQSQASPSDNDDHGTHVAGIIGAVLNNNKGIAGVASNIDVKLMSLKINGGPKGTGNIAGAIEAVKYAERMGADICNMSWGTAESTDALNSMIKDSDMLFVAAAGNSGVDNNIYPIYPANLDYDNVISVTFINPLGELTKSSNYGSNTVDLAAPGEDITSTVVGNYATMSGSSMAAPHVTAVAALLYSYGEYLYPANIKENIINNLKQIKALEGMMKYPGIPDAGLAVKNADDLIEDYDPPVLSLSTKYTDNKFTLSLNYKEEGGSGIRVVKWIYGSKKITDFAHGVAGTKVTGNQLQLSKAGTYTFYVSDYAGNEIIKVYKVEEDITKPSINTGYTVAGDYKTRTVTVSVSDRQSGVKKIKYMSGVKKASDFLPAGAGISLNPVNGKVSFKVSKDGIYTIFASDHRGNLAVKQIEVKTIKITNLKLTQNIKELKSGEAYLLRVYKKPTNATDKITYTSSDPDTVAVTGQGRVTALKEGTATITITADSGVTTTCKIIVKN